MDGLKPRLKEFLEKQKKVLVVPAALVFTERLSDELLDLLSWLSELLKDGALQHLVQKLLG